MKATAYNTIITNDCGNCNWQFFGQDQLHLPKEIEI